MRTAVAASLCVLVLGCSSSKPTSAVPLLSEETVASRDGRDGSVTLHQDAALWIALLSNGEKVAHAIGPERTAWVQVARGEVIVPGTGEVLKAGDGAAVTDQAALELTARGAGDSEVLVFDLPRE